MDIAGITIGLREAVIGLITLVAVYIVFVLLRMSLLHKRPAPLPEPIPPSLKPEPEKAAEPDPVVPDVPPADAWEQAREGLGDEMLRQGLELEFAQLRDEVDAIRGELAALREDMQQELAHLRAGQSVSPIYGDAMQMAVAGYDPAMISERCGIARAEAELVVALAKSQER